MSTSVEQCRFNMIEQQIRPAGILDERVLQALMGLPRDAFVCDKYKHIAYCDVEIPIYVNGETSHESMLVPRMEARFAEALQLQHSDTVLEIGTGTGFQAALLSRLCTQVTTVDINPAISALAQENLNKNHISNVRCEVGDAQNGWGNGEYNAVLVTGSLPTLPDRLKYNLAVGGRLVVVIGQGPVQRLMRITRLSASDFSETCLQETQLRPLHGVQQSQFKF